MASGKSTIAGLFAFLASIGVVHADEGALEINHTDEWRQVAINRLLEGGLIIRLPQSGWYQIDRERLMEATAVGVDGDSAIGETIRLLQALVGDEVDIREVDFMRASAGTQDYSPKN